MKILMPNHFPLQGSGSGIYTLNVALELLRAGHEIMVIVPDHQPVNEYPFTTKTIIFSNGDDHHSQLDFNFPCFTTHPCSTKTFYELTDSEMQAYIQAWRQHINEAILEFQPDVIHAHHVWVTPYIAFETGLPYVISCHGTDLMGYKKGPRYRQLALTGAQNAYKIIAISRQVQSEAIKTYQLSNAKVSLIWNGFGTDHFKLLPDVTKKTVLNEFGLTGEDKPLVSFVGKFTHFKGIDVLLKAAAIYENRLHGVQTVLVGHGGLWDQMQALQKKLGLKGVHFLGHQPQDKVARIFNAADISIVPSRVEPFGLVAVEALACGTPVVATDAGGLPDFINEDVGALVPIDDPDLLAHAIINEIENNTKQSKGIYANQYAYENFTWKKQVEQMISLYQQALDSN
ncbi:MAG: glycosyltransferase family 4 protein [Deltaproteobacteria bacterium]|nr:glycosyltransferase family 4 protein [Deltaproteobacteria bacterium]